ncbi:MAG: hypothetical protein AAFR53_05885 [Pseudomonadota bacterium]
MAYAIATLLLLAFIANVVMGAIGQSAPVGIVTEMLILFGAAIAFSVGILRSEARQKSQQDKSD